MSKRISILGCGWLGLPLARFLVVKGHVVKGATTTESKVDMLSDVGIEPYLLKFDPDQTGDEKDFFDTDILVINIPPRSRTKDAGYHPSQIKAINQKIVKDIPTVLFVSSTSIYPKEDGEYTESYQMDRETCGNKAIYDAEQFILDHFKADNKYILRSAGQMGLERIPGKYYAGKDIKGANDRINYIHQDDLVGLLSYIIDHEPEPGIYNLVTKNHPIKRDVVSRSIEKMGFEEALPSSNTAGKSRIVSGEKVLNNWDYNFKYPDPMEFEY